jgi:hypothetical protein
VCPTWLQFSSSDFIRRIEKTKEAVNRKPPLVTRAGAALGYACWGCPWLRVLGLPKLPLVTRAGAAEASPTVHAPKFEAGAALTSPRSHPTQWALLAQPVTPSMQRQNAW